MTLASRRPLSASLLITALLTLSLLISACATHTVRTTQATPLLQEQNAIAEDELLDVGIHLFNPGLDDDDLEDKDSIIFPEIRKAEARFMPYHLMETLQSSAAWGAVRVIPSTQSSVDLVVEGEILLSDGERLELMITITDATGLRWYQKNYEGIASRYAYSKHRASNVPAEPFQNLYTDIANDLLTFRRQEMQAAQLRRIRTIAELKFAQSFSPDAFSKHITKTPAGDYEIQQLPATNDPMMQRIRLIRERDYLFVDTLQDYYASFIKDMEKPYRQWRQMSYDESVALREMEREALGRKLVGMAAIVGGIMAAGSNSSSGRSAANIGIASGAYIVKSGFDKSAESAMHVEALQELGDSLEAAIEPQVIELEDRTITLSGSVENQYGQWRDLLRDIYKIDTGL